MGDGPSKNAVTLMNRATVVEVPSEGAGIVVVMVPCDSFESNKAYPMVTELAIATGNALAKHLKRQHHTTQIIEQYKATRLKKLSAVTPSEEES